MDHENQRVDDVEPRDIQPEGRWRQGIRVPCIRAGLFAELNAIVNAWICAEMCLMLPMPDWRRSRYAESGRDAWDELFLRVGHTPEQAYRAKHTLPARCFVGARNSPIQPRGRPVPGGHVRGLYDLPLLPPLDRRRVRRVLDKHLRIRDEILEQVASAGHRLRQQSLIGVHCRGPGRLHGGVEQLRRHFALAHPPYPLFFEQIDVWLGRVPECQLLVCTDAGVTQQEFLRRYGRRVVFATSSQLDLKGEAHVRRGNARMGHEALRDALLLATVTERLVHGNSNVSNFIRCYNPDLECVDVYEQFYGQISVKANA